MPVDRLIPAGPGYTEIAVGTGRRLVQFAGQCPLGPDGEVTGTDDVEAQTRVVVANLRARMEHAGVGADDVIKTTVYVVGDRAALAAAWRVFAESGVTGVPLAPSTLVGVTVLGFEGQLVEIEALALVEG